MALNYTHTSGSHHLLSGGTSKFAWTPGTDTAKIDILKCGATTTSGLTVTRPSSTATTWTGTYSDSINRTVTITNFVYTSATGNVSGNIRRNCNGLGDDTSDDIGTFSGVKNV